MTHEGQRTGGDGTEQVDLIMLGLEAGREAAANLWAITEGEGLPGLEDSVATINWAIEARASSRQSGGVARSDDLLRTMLEDLREQCNRGRYSNALRRVADITRELVNRQETIHREQARRPSGAGVAAGASDAD